MTKIRTLVYNHTFVKKLNFHNVLEKVNNIEINKNYYNMLNLISLNIYLGKRDINLFILLFPQFKQTFKNYEYVLKYITKYIIKNYNVFTVQSSNIDKILKNDLSLETIELPSEIPINFNKLNKLVMILFIDIKNKKINLNVNENYDILYDFLNNLIYLDYYYSYFYN